MFTWICPQCGREVPPSYSECPDCAERAKASANAQITQAGQTPQQPVVQSTAPPTPVASPPAATAAPLAAPQPGVQYVYVQQRRGQPGWLVALLVAVGLLAIGAGAYYFLPSVRANREAGLPAAPQMETPAASKGGAETPAATRIAKHIEVTGLRIVEENKRPVIKYVVVNHSNAEFAGLKGNLILHASNAAPGSQPIATVPVDIASMGGYEVKDIASPLKTSLRAYELPDWQYLKADLQLTSP
jgi:hypothetical protein